MAAEGISDFSWLCIEIKQKHNSSRLDVFSLSNPTGATISLPKSNECSKRMKNRGSMLFHSAIKRKRDD